MTIERMLRLLGGLVVLLGLVLSRLHSPHWLWLVAFAGVNMLQSAFTDWCPAVWVLKKMGLSRCCATRSGFGERPPCTDSSVGSAKPLASGGHSLLRADHARQYARQ